MAQERRKHPRRKPQPGLSIRCAAVEPAGAAPTELSAKIVDVSAKGACIEVARPLSAGASLQVEIVPPDSKTPVNVRAIVRWWRTLDEKGQQAHLAGLEFDRAIEALGAKGGDPVVLEILHDLRVTVAQLRLYPKDSPQALRTVTDMYQPVHAYLEENEGLTLTRTARDLLVNGRPLPATGTVADSLRSATLALLADAQIKSICLKKGLTLEELSGFLQALTRKFWDVRDGKEINRRLREERVFRITVDEVQYVALGEGDLVIEDAARKLAGSGTAIGELMAKLDQVVDAAAQEGLGAEGRLHLMKRLLEKDPTLLDRVREGRPVEGAAAAQDSELGLLDYNQAQEVIGDLTRLLREVPPAHHGRIRRIGEMLAGAFSHSPSLHKAIQALLTEQAAEALKEELSSAPAAPAVSGAVSRAKAIAGLHDEEMLQAMAQEGTALIEELSALGEKETARSLLGAVQGSLSDRSPRRRIMGIRALAGLQKALEKHATPEMLSEMERTVLSALDDERDPGAYHALGDLAVFLADLMIRQGNYERARPMIAILRRHYQIKDENFVKRAELAYAALERLAAGGGVAGLAVRVRDGDPEAIDLIEALDAAAAPLLIREIKGGDAPARRVHYARLLSRAGRGASSILLEEIQKTFSPTELGRLIEALPHAAPPDMAELALGPLLRNGAVNVRRRAAQTLMEQGYPHAGMALLGALAAEKDAGTRAAFVDCLGRLKPKEALDTLCGLAESRAEPEEVRVAACLSLARIGDARALPILLRLASRREKGLTSILRAPVPAPVRAAAARALAAFPGEREARDALRRAHEDRDPGVRAAAAQARFNVLQDVFGDLATGIEMVAAPGEIGPAPVKYAGAIDEVPLDPLLRRLAAAEKTGILVLHIRGRSAGRIHLDAGVAIAVEFENLPDQEAFIALSARPEGFFLFLPDPAALVRRVLIPVDALLEAAERVRGG